MTLAAKTYVGERAQIAAHQAWRALSINGARVGCMPTAEEIVLAVLVAAGPEMAARQKQTLVGKLRGLIKLRGQELSAVPYNNAVQDCLELLEETL